MSNKIVGIDLGTTNSVVSIVEGGEPVVIPSTEGSSMFPSVVGFSKTGDRLVGTIAKRQAISNPERTINSIKRHMGTEYRVRVDEKEYTPQEISSMILQKIKADAEAYLGFPVEKAVLTVPAYFNDGERQSTKDAGTIAGLEIVRIINEPTASTLAYGLDKLETSETVLVWDLGGGTFDVSILELGSGVFEVKSTAGNVQLGGDDWDQRIMDWLIDEFRHSHNIDLRTDRVAMQRLKEASEQAKINLSSETITRVNLPFIAADASGPKHLDVELSRGKFQELTQDLLDKTEEPALRALEDAGLTPNKINRVLMVGGSTRMPAVRDKVRTLFGKEPCTDIDPDKVVSMGAAIQGAILGGEVKDIVLLDVTSLSLGIETVGGVFTKLIDRNSQIPCSKSKIFTTATDKQSVVEVHVLQGERDMASHNKSLGRFELRNIPPAPRGVPQIEVTFEIDANGIVNVSAKDLATGNKQKITISSPTGLSDDEINRMVKEAALYSEEDAKRRSEAQARNKANIEIDTAERMMRELSERIPGDQQRRLKDLIEKLRMALQTYDTDRIFSDTKDLTDAMFAISTDAYLDTGTGRVMNTEFASEKVIEFVDENKSTTTEEEPTDEDLFGWFT
jgi:molecular chaperone DnaK